MTRYDLIRAGESVRARRWGVAAVLYREAGMRRLGNACAAMAYRTAHPDYRCISEGRRRVLCLCPTTGATVSIDAGAARVG